MDSVMVTRLIPSSARGGKRVEGVERVEGVRKGVEDKVSEVNLASLNKSWEHCKFKE